jgi:hypothetical protein
MVFFKGVRATLLLTKDLDFGEAQVACASELHTDISA